ncbi:MAG: hypothetical protein Q8N88_02180 [Nanoarchaeota archaeon]|nr:hypothetical protein [Nanoarchaeota archaeon]
MRMDLVEKAEELVREENISDKERNRKFPLITVAVARASLGMGLNLENICPYVRECDLQIKSKKLCIYPENYRNTSCYKVKMTTDTLNGRFDSLMPELLEVSN